MPHIILCMKIIIDPEIPFSIFNIDRENRKPVPPSGIPPLFSPFDENALEAALRMKDQGDCRVTVLSLGKTIPKAVLQKALAVGADEAIALEDPEFDDLDPFNTARALADAVKKIGEYDLIFMGRQAADWDAGLVWAGVAELLDIPSITIAGKTEIMDGKLLVERFVSDGIEVLESDMPALVTFTSEAGELRNVSLSALMKVRKQEIPRWSASDLGFSRSAMMEIGDLYEPDLGLVDCYLVQGESAEEKGRRLARKLLEEGIIHTGM